jgi:hypothetical protein
VNGPWIASTQPGSWIPTKSVFLSCEKVGPANSESPSTSLRKNVSPPSVEPTRSWRPSPSSAMISPP